MPRMTKGTSPPEPLSSCLQELRAITWALEMQRAALAVQRFSMGNAEPPATRSAAPNSRTRARYWRRNTAIFSRRSSPASEAHGISFGHGEIFQAHLQLPRRGAIGGREFGGVEDFQVLRMMNQQFRQVSAGAGHFNGAPQAAGLARAGANRSGELAMAVSKRMVFRRARSGKSASRTMRATSGA